MTDVPTMKIVASDVPPTGTFSSGTGKASATAATMSSAQTPASVSGLGSEAANAIAATVTVRISATTTGRSSGRSRAVSRPISARRRRFVFWPPFRPGAATQECPYLRQVASVCQTRSTHRHPSKEGALRKDVKLRFGIAGIPAPVHDRSGGHVGDAPESGLRIPRRIPVAAERLGALVVGEDLAQARARNRLLEGLRPPLLRPLQARGRALARGARLEVEHLGVDVVVRVSKRAVLGRGDRLGRGGGALDGHHHVVLRDDPVVGGRPGGVENRARGLGEGRAGEHVAHLQEAWNADSLVLRCDLVPRDREARLVPADADP